MQFWARPNVFIECSFKFGGDKTPLWCEFEEDLIFQRIFRFSETLEYCLIVFKYGFWARLDVWFICSLEFTHLNYFLMDPLNLISLTSVFIFNVNLVKCRMCKITFSIWLCERLTLSESVYIFGEKLTLTCFQMWFKYKGIRCSFVSRKVKPSFSNWFSERTTLLESNSVFDIARWTFTCFRVWYLSSSSFF